MLAINSNPAMNKPPQLAILIAAPQTDESAMINDMTAMLQVLQGREVSPDQPYTPPRFDHSRDIWHNSSGH